MKNKTYCGFITLVGKPNVGKSTLLNTLCGKKISIISRKPQTTRHRITAIKTESDSQFVFIDTPGLHRRPKHKLNKLMIKSALSATKDVDVLVFIINPKNWNDEDELILKKLARLNTPIIAVLNKSDQIKNKNYLLEFISKLEEKAREFDVKFESIVLISAKYNDGVDLLEKQLKSFLPESPFMFPSDCITERSNSFISGEFIREKLMRFLGEEVPHSTTVEIEKFKLEKHKKTILHISAIIWVEREGQKKIVIGNKGENLKNIATLARKDLELFFGEQIFLQLWVKVKKGWVDNINALSQLGYREV